MRMPRSLRSPRIDGGTTGSGTAWLTRFELTTRAEIPRQQHRRDGARSPCHTPHG